MEIIQRIASFFLDLPEAASPPFVVFMAFDMAGDSSKENCRVKVSYAALGAACGVYGAPCLPERDFSIFTTRPEGERAGWATTEINGAGGLLGFNCGSGVCWHGHRQAIKQSKESYRELRRDL